MGGWGKNLALAGGSGCLSRGLVGVGVQRTCTPQPAMRQSSSPVMHDACDDLGQNYLKTDIIQSVALHALVYLFAQYDIRHSHEKVESNISSLK